MAENPLAGLKATLRGALITRDDKDAFTAARLRGWNRDLNSRANPLGFAVVSGVRDIVTTVNYCRSNKIPIAVRGKGAQRFWHGSGRNLRGLVRRIADKSVADACS